MIPSLFAVILRTVLYPPPETHSGPRQAFKMDTFAELVKIFKLTLLTIFANVLTYMFRRVLNTSLTGSNAGN